MIGVNRGKDKAKTFNENIALTVREKRFQMKTLFLSYKLRAL